MIAFSKEIFRVTLHKETERGAKMHWAHREPQLEHLEARSLLPELQVNC